MTLYDYLIVVLPALILARSFVMLSTMTENNKISTIILIT